ncbi:MAG TPA: glutamyl-tRNA reductase [Planctomycetota bacterium]|nr:glutamyl-tRNA reductase [Planctomycetota bacterium]
MSAPSNTNDTPVLQQTLRLVGLSHHTAPVAIRERLAFRLEDQPRALGLLLARGCHEAAILSTCNRVEVLAVGRDPSIDVASQVRQFLSEFHGISEKEFASSLYVHHGVDAARHLFEVAASLDSQILGETEILSQSKEAYRIAAEVGSCGSVLRGLFERAFFLAKELRADGGIGRTQASVSSAAVQLAKKVFEIEGRKVLVIGTGEMATGIVRALRSAGVGEVWVASRTAARAQEFAEREGGKACDMAHLIDHLSAVDIVLVSSAAPHYIIGPAQINEAQNRRRGRMLCLIDISVPRNVDPAVNDIEDTYLYDIDDLEEVARDGRREREAIAERWRPRLAEESREILRKLSDRGTQDAAKKLIEQAAAIRMEVLKQVRAGGLDPRALEEIERALERLQGRLLHGPLETLKQAVRDGDGAEATAWINRLFRLEAQAAHDSTGLSSEELTQPRSCKTPETPDAKSSGATSKTSSNA